MFDLFESLFGTTQSSTTSKEAQETATRDATTNVASNSQPRRGRQQLRDRSTVVDGTCHMTKHTSTGLGVSQSCPPPIHRNSPSNAKDSVNSSNHRQKRTTVNGKGPDGKKHNPINAPRVTTTTNNHPSHRMDNAHYRDHSCPPSLSSTTTRQQAHTTTKTSQKQERENCNSNDSHRKNQYPSVLSNNKNCHAKKTKDLVSVMRNEPNRLAFLRTMIRGQQHRRVGSNISCSDTN